MHSALRLSSAFAFASVLTVLAAAPCAQQATAPPAKERPPAAATLGLGDGIPWRTDGAEFHEPQRRAEPPKVDRGALIDAAIADAKQQQKLVLWYVHRIREKTLNGAQMYRSPVLDTYMRQVLFEDADVADLCTHAFVPVRCMIDQPLSDRFGLKPLAFVEPAVVFLDGDGNVVHFVERIRTFHAHWFADLCVRVLERAGVSPGGPADADALRARGRWRDALAALQRGSPGPNERLAAARVHRLLRQPEQALAAAAEAAAAATAADDGADRALLADALCEQGLVLSMLGRPLDAQPLLERSWRSDGARSAEAGYWHALNALKLGDEVGAMRRFALVADKHPDTRFGRRARANTTLGPDDRPLGAAFTGFESLEYLPDAAYHAFPKDTTWQGDRLDAAAMAQAGVRYLLAQQRDDGGFTDARYAYWPNSEITPNVWVAITAIVCTALLEHRAACPDLHERIDRALARGETYLLDEKRLNRGANEDCYSDAYRLMYFARRTAAADGDARQRLIARMNEIVQAAAARQKASGFWAHEYENAFATGAVLQQVLAARAAGATVPDEVTDKAAQALLSARFQNGTYVYGGAAGKGRPTGLKDSAGRMPVCEGSLLQLGRSDLDKVRFALQNFWDHMQNLEGVRRNDFHSDGELGGFFFFHSVFHASEVVRLLPADEQAPHWPRFVELLQRIPELDGSHLDSHELGRSYGTAMALLTLANARA